MVGERYGRLVAVKELPDRNADRRIIFECLCECGNTTKVTGKSLRSGHTKSCGCLEFKKPLKDNAVKRHELYPTYTAMKTRCYNKNFEHYHHYGGRGIKVCDRWLESFWNYVEDVGPKVKGKTLDRENNDGDYEPGNVRWATPKEQAANRRPNSGWRNKSGSVHT